MSNQPRRGPYAPGKRENYPIRKSITLSEEQALKMARLANERRITSTALMRQLLEEA